MAIFVGKPNSLRKAFLAFLYVYLSSGTLGMIKLVVAGSRRVSRVVVLLWSVAWLILSLNSFMKVYMLPLGLIVGKLVGLKRLSASWLQWQGGGE